MGLTVAQKEQLASELKSYGCSDLLSVVEAHAEACLWVRPTDEDPHARVGHHRFGGDPDLPPDFEWPTSGKTPFVGRAAFIAQIRLDALGTAHGLLPSAGLLSIFCFGTDSAADPIDVAVYHFRDCSALRRRAIPPTEIADQYLRELRPVAVDLAPEVEINWSALLDPYEEVEASLSDRLASLRPERETRGIGQLLGFPHDHDCRDLRLDVTLTAAGRPELIPETFIQSIDQYRQTLARMRIEREREHEKQQGHTPSFSLHHTTLRLQELEEKEQAIAWWAENRPRLLEESRRWHTVLRLDSNKEMGLWINDADPLFVFAHERDLRVGVFSNAPGRVLQR